MPVTRFGLEGYGVRRAGSFGAKTPDSGAGPHPVGILTRFALDGYGARRAGLFSGKTTATPTPTPTGQVGTGSGGGRAFGHYPPILDKRALKRTITRAAREKKRIERQLQFATGPTALERLLRRLNEKQELLAVRMEEYRSLLSRERSEAEEEMEFIEMITELL